ILVAPQAKALAPPVAGPVPQPGGGGLGGGARGGFGGGAGGIGAPGFARPGEMPPFGGGDRFDGRRLDANNTFLPPLPPTVVREYAHHHTSGMTPELRSDWTETLYWHPILLLPNGKADVSFELCDSPTPVQVA